MTLDNDLVQNKTQGRPMLEQTEWVPLNKQHHTLVDDEFRIIANVWTTYAEEDGDENYLWEVEVDGEEFGNYVSLYLAKLDVQMAIARWDAKLAAEAKKPKTKPAAKKKETKKKVNARK
jgi:hypothetical protein